MHKKGTHSDINGHHINGKNENVQKENSPYKTALSLLFHQDVREQLHSDISGCAMEQGVSLSLLSGIDQVGLELDAQERASYILSSLKSTVSYFLCSDWQSQQGKGRYLTISFPHLISWENFPIALAFGLHLERLLIFSILPKSITPPVLLLFEWSKHYNRFVYN